MSVKLEWSRVYDSFKAQVRLGDCECDVTIRLYGDPSDEFISIDIPPNERLPQGWISIRPVLDGMGNLMYWIHVHVAGRHGYYDNDGIAFNLYSAVAKALELARIMYKWREGRIKSPSRFGERLSEAMDDCCMVFPVPIDDIGEDKEFKPTFFTPAEAREALHVVEQVFGTSRRRTAD